MRVSRRLAVAAALLLFAVPASAAEPHLALVRIESLDAVLDDVERLAALAGRDMTRQQLYDRLGSLVGGADLGWLDGGRPWVAVVSTTALVQGPQALVVAVPVSDPAAATAALEASFLDQAADEDGIRLLDSGRQLPLATLFRDGYMVASPSRETALAFRPLEQLDRGQLPPGNVAVEVFLEPVAPMAMAGLESARTMLEQRMSADSSEPGWEQEEWEEEGEEEPAQDDSAADEPPGEPQSGPPAEPQSEPADDAAPAAVPDLDPAAFAAVFDLYVDLLRSLLASTSRMQISLELGESHLLVHQRVVPVAGSTLEDLLAAQRGGLPELARFVEPADGSTVQMVGQLTPTPAFLAATREFLGRYREAMASMLEQVEGSGEGLPGSPLLRFALDDIDRWVDCYRGDFASAFELSDAGFGGVQLFGVRDAELCQELVEHLAEMAAGWTGEPAAAPVRADLEALDYKGVRAVGYELDLGEVELEPEADEPPLPAWMQQKLLTYTGLWEELMLSTAGPDAEAAFRRLVDRLAGGAEPAGSGGGLTAERFAPLTLGPGVFALFDFRDMAGTLPADGGEQVERLFAEIGEGAPMLYGLRMVPGSMHAQFALPLSFLSAIGRAGAAAAEEQPQPDAAP